VRKERPDGPGLLKRARGMGEKKEWGGGKNQKAVRWGVVRFASYEDRNVEKKQGASQGIRRRKV